jgi:transposase
VSREVIDDDLAVIDALELTIDRLDWEIHQRARSDPRVKVLTKLPGVGPFTALVILAEIGDISRSQAEGGPRSRLHPARQTCAGGQDVPLGKVPHEYRRRV